ncbi:Cytochrome b5 heme-binding domain-containing protein [Meloidogyne graminicola]|uniref:Cytochrome b5 n=1 Tax=Meloidogyne graminicola TaxID=189291 RepID=A0A8S9ZZF8_9BILA|nr:Cytochrome b5 heme-binding domain-containing protein [Meloidogyne graminicola]
MTGGNQFTRSEVAERNSSNNCWIIIGNKVYDVTKFLDEHPGGCEVLLEKAGEDRTEAFEDIGHSTDARKMKEDYCIGEVIEDERWKYSYDKRELIDKKTNNIEQQSKYNPIEMFIYCLLFGIIAALIYYLLIGS